ncbi:MAG TPA: hypothetical protein VGM29_18460 [Polyangiaceae bacterium]|jgi:hypothetical protein
MSSLSLDPKHVHGWLGGYARAALRRLTTPGHDGPRHVLFAICDHYEPLWGHASDVCGEERVRRWLTRYPEVVRELYDADGRTPRHSFFFPGEQYRPEYLEALARLAHRGYGEVELHLHHDGDDAEKLTSDLTRYLAAYAEHGHLSRDADGKLRYAFIHGNWCLANSRQDGRYCGVDSELDVLFETGCYADFTFPSAPDETQPKIVNQIYWPEGAPGRARAHESGVRARVGQTMSDRILMIQGPLALARRSRGFGIRIDGAALTARDPASPSRLATWISQGIHIEGRPEWVFVKLHTHGAPEAQADSLLGKPGRALHELLARHYNDGERYVLHYVTAREMFNIARAGMAGRSGNPNAYRDYVLPPPPVAS